MHTQKSLLFVLYDSIENSVFSSQVLSPLIKKKLDNPALSITVVSFERMQPSYDLLALLQSHGIKYIVYKRYPFIGIFSLLPAAYVVRRLLKRHYAQKPYTLIARGPHASWICGMALKTLGNHHCAEFVMQVRGLVAQEFIYTQKQRNPNNTFLSYWFAQWRFYTLLHLEKNVYQSMLASLNAVRYLVEVVSPALKKFIIEQHHVASDKITIAHADIPSPISKEQKNIWRNQIRKQLAISEQQYVFCYNGSIKPWQCPEKIISFFKQKQQEIGHIFLLVLTQQKKEFTAMLTTANINPSSYYVCTVPHTEIYQYLAACDAGLLLRENNIINWVSRPTKMLEYEAVQLPIIHNNTVELLASNANHIVYDF